MKLSRRTFIASAALLPVACGSPLSYEHGVSVSPPSPAPWVRPPQIGQEWSYLKQDAFSGKTLGSITERVSSVARNIVIERQEDGMLLPNEIQIDWGYVSIDPQWPKVLNFSPALPLWPKELSVGWSKQFFTKYSILGYQDDRLTWQEYMEVKGWERITVPAGEFVALRYENTISYQSEDPNKTNCLRKEIIWFAPEIGRWVARETSGSFQIQGQLGNVNREGSYQWQLTSYK